MPVDPHADEPIAELDPVKWALYVELLKAMEAGKQRLEALRKEFEEAIGPAYAGVVDGKKVITYRPRQGTYNTTLLRKEYGELTQHFMREETKDVLDMELFAKAYPEYAAKYQTRDFKVYG